MKTKIESIWERLLIEKNGDEVAQKTGKIVLVDENHPFNLYAGIDEDGRLTLALNLKERPQSVQIKSDAFHCFRQQRLDESWFFILALEQSSLAPVFGRLCQDLVDTSWSIRDERELERLFVERLLLWKRLFDMGSDGLLGESKIRGLIGELFVFRRLMELSGFSHEAIAESWVGPLSAPQDFQFSDRCLEVKAVSQNNPNVKISSLEQLDSALPIRLSVVKLEKVDDSPSKLMDLNSLVAEIEGLLDLRALKTFRDRLLEAGYVDHPHYDSFKYSVVDYSEYVVTSAFPKLTPSTVHSGITAADYAISLESIELFRD